MVAPDGAAARLLEDHGWVLDGGRTHAGPGHLQPPARSIRVAAPAPARLPAHGGPGVEQEAGAHQLEIVVGDREPRAITPR